MYINKLSFFNYSTNNNTSTPKATSFKGKKQRNVTNPVKAESFYPAGDLFLMAENDVKTPELIIDEFYANENSRLLKNPLGVSLSRFSQKDKYDILQYAEDIKLHKKGFSKIINAKNEDKTYRFNALESLALFFDAGDKIEKCRDEFDRIVNEKDSNNNPRFNGKDCALLMDNIELAKMYPNAFNSVLAIKELNAKDIINLMLKDGEIIEENPELFDNAKQLNENASNKAKQLSNTIKELYIEKCKQIADEKVQQREKEEVLINEKKQKEAEEKAKIEQQKQINREIAIRKREEKLAIKRAEENKIKQEKIEYWNQKVGWIPPEQLFEKVNEASEKGIALVLENGEILPDETRDKISYYINKSKRKAKNIVNARYKNMQPIFNEKECCNILSDLDSYYYCDCMGTLKSVYKDGTPVFSAQQCKELLRLKQSYRDGVISHYLLSTYRHFSPEDIVNIMKNSNAVLNHDSPFRTLIIEKNENGQFRYNLEQCIEISKKKLK